MFMFNISNDYYWGFLFLSKMMCIMFMTQHRLNNHKQSNLRSQLVLVGLNYCLQRQFHFAMVKYFVKICF